jgi:hypothetical protein
MNKEKIIYVCVLGAVFLGVFAVYHFYFAAKLEQYAKHEQLLTALQQTETSLVTTFGTAEPDDVIRDHRGKVESWREAITSRVPYFSDAEWRTHEKPPEDVFILQFWYGDESRKMVTELWEKAQKAFGPQVYQRMPSGFPNEVQSMLGVAYSEQWQGMDIKAEQVNAHLERLRFGISAFELLMDSNVMTISTLGVEELKHAGFIDNGVTYTRLKLSFTMEMEALVDFLEKLRLADTFYSIEGMRISHPYILYKYEPKMQVDMYLLRATQGDDFVSSMTTTSATASTIYSQQIGGLGGRGVGRGDDDDEVVAEPGAFGRGWKWFKRTVLYTN